MPLCPTCFQEPVFSYQTNLRPYGRGATTTASERLFVYLTCRLCCKQGVEPMQVLCKGQLVAQYRNLRWLLDLLLKNNTINLNGEIAGLNFRDSLPEILAKFWPRIGFKTKILLLTEIWKQEEIWEMSSNKLRFMKQTLLQLITKAEWAPLLTGFQEPEAASFWAKHLQVQS